MREEHRAESVESAQVCEKERSTDQRVWREHRCMSEEERRAENRVVGGWAENCMRVNFGTHKKLCVTKKT